MSKCLAILTAVFLSGCVHYQVSIDAYGSDGAAPKSFHMFEPDFLPRSDLANAEIYEKIEAALQSAGYVKAPPTEAGQLIVATWAADAPVTVPTVKIAPTVGLVNSGSSFTGSAQTYGNTTVGSGTVTNRQQLGITGFQPVQGFVTTTPQGLVISSLEIAKLPAESPPMLWKVDVRTQGQASDMRSALDAMITAAAPYFGKNPGRTIVAPIYIQTSPTAPQFAGPN